MFNDNYFVHLVYINEMGERVEEFHQGFSLDDYEEVYGMISGDLIEAHLRKMTKEEQDSYYKSKK